MRDKIPFEEIEVLEDSGNDWKGYLITEKEALEFIKKRSEHRRVKGMLIAIRNIINSFIPDNSRGR